MPKKVLLDTDIGSDIDDAVCLAYLLAHPDCELLGITTVSGQPLARARLASALCHVAGKRIPIYPGIAQPLLIDQQQREAQQAAALHAWPHQAAFIDGFAINFMRDTIRANPGEISLIAIGPMTNIGLLFAGDPELPGLLKELVLMCGVFLAPPEQNALEWNAKLDPHATAITYRATPPVHRSIGLDVTRQVTMDAAAVREAFQAPLLRPVLDFANVWFEHADHITFHDPLAAVTLFRDDICTYQSGRVSVDVTNPDRLGATDWQPSTTDAPHTIADTVNADAFFSEFFSTLE